MPRGREGPEKSNAERVKEPEVSNFLPNDVLASGKQTYDAEQADGV